MDFLPADFLPPIGDVICYWVTLRFELQFVCHLETDDKFYDFPIAGSKKSILSNVKHFIKCFCKIEELSINSFHTVDSFAPLSSSND
jgi:hypothetical protein